MVSVAPFAAFRPDPKQVAEIASPPYDVVDDAEAREFVAQRPLSFLRVVRPDVNLAEGASDAEQHAEAKRRFWEMVEQGQLIQEAEPCFYLYRQSQGGHVQRGIVGTCAVAEYASGAIKKHEHVRPKKVVDRTEHFLAVEAQTGPIFLSARSDAALSAYLDGAFTGAPLYDFKDEVGVRHELFKAADSAAVSALFEGIPALYIADGHHRTASACAVRDKRQEAGALSASDASHRFMAVIFPEDELHIIAYNRLVTDIGGRSAAELKAAIAEVAPVSPCEPGAPTERGFVHATAGEGWFRIDLRNLVDETAPPQEHLDAHLLQANIIGPLLGIEDPRADDRIFFWGGHKGADRMDAAVTSGQAKAAFFLYPVTMGQVMDVADADKVMPPKSTWFEPKLRSGLFSYDLRPKG